MNIIKNINSEESPLVPCLVLKRWRDIDPSQEFRCFVINKELVGKFAIKLHKLLDSSRTNHLILSIFIGICQRDVSQYYKYIENEKYDIQRDIKSLFLEKIKDKFYLDDCKQR